MLSDAGERQALVQAQREIRAQFGGRKLDHRWQDDRVTLVWQSDAGERLVIAVDPNSGRWQVMRRARSRR